MRLVSLLALFAALAPPALAQERPVPGEALTNRNVSPVNLRAGPGTANAVLGRIAPGQSGTVAACNADASWCQIDTGEVLGWASVPVLQPADAPVATAPAPAPAPAPTAAQPGGPGLPAPGTLMVVAYATGVPLLTEPSAGAPVLAFLPEGARAVIEDCRPDWCRIDVAGTEGWVPAVVARASAQAPAAPAPAAPAPTAPSGGGVTTTVLDATAPAANPVEAPGEQIVNRNASFVNLRAEPSTGSAIQGRIAPGEAGTSLGCTEAGDWCRLRTDGAEGWAFLAVLAPSEPPAPAAPPVRAPAPGEVDALASDVRSVLGLPAAPAAPIAAPQPQGGPVVSRPGPAASIRTPVVQAPIPVGGRAYDNRTDGVVNLRAGPGTQFDQLGGLAPGEGGTVGPDCAPGADWCELRLDAGGGRAWVKLSLLTQR